MDTDRLPFKAYRMLYKLGCKGKVTWASSIRKCLCKYGFSYVWNNQGVGSESCFLKCFKQRIIDCRWQDWDDHVQTSDRFSVYRTFKTSNMVEPYLFLNIHKSIRRSLVIFRCGVSDIVVHSHRYKTFDMNNMKCRMCKSSMEDETHFLLHCPVLLDLREQYIPQKYFRHPCTFKMSLLLSSRNAKVLKNLALYLYKSFRRLNAFVD